MMKHDEIKEIAMHYGYENQRMKLIEEIGELLQAMNRLYEAEKEGDNARISYAIDWVAEEAADVKIMLDQRIYLLDIVQMTGDWYDVKIERQLRRIKEKVEDRCPVPVIYGVHGIHEGKQYKAYAWRIPEKAVVEVGDIVRVNAAGKQENVLVVGKGVLPKADAKHLKSMISIVNLSKKYEVADGK